MVKCKDCKHYTPFHKNPYVPSDRLTYLNPEPSSFSCSRSTLSITAATQAFAP